MPFTSDTFTHLFSWDQDPQRQEKIINARLEAELDGIDTGLSAQAARITTISPASGQIAFPATQNPSADANTLDDYEEGTWTPALTFVAPGDLSVTYSQQVGHYVKIGLVATCWFDVRTSAFTHTTASGAATITGLPFTVLSGGISFRGGSSAWSGVTKANYTDALPAAIVNTTTIQFSISGSAVAASVINAADMPTGGSVLLLGCAVYKVN